MTRLTDTQLILLSTASNRTDSNLYPTPASITARPDQIHRLVEALIRKQLARDFQTEDAACGWRCDEANCFGVAITDAGRATLAMVLPDDAADVTDATPSDLRNLLLKVNANIAVGAAGLTISLCPDHLEAKLLGSAETLERGTGRVSISVAVSLVRKGQELRLAYPPQDRDAPANPDVKLIGLIAKAEAAHRELVSDAAILPTRRPHLLRLARLKFLAPDIVTAILDGRQPATLSARQLLRESTMPLCWQEQRQLLGFRAHS